MKLMPPNANASQVTQFSLSKGRQLGATGASVITSGMLVTPYTKNSTTSTMLCVASDIRSNTKMTPSIARNMTSPMLGGVKDITVRKTKPHQMNDGVFAMQRFFLA